MKLSIRDKRYLTGKKILLISPESWSHLFVSKHNYSIALATLGNTVFFLNPPGDQWSINQTSYSNVWEINYTRFIKGLRFFPSWFQRLCFRKKYKQLENLAGTKFDVVWSFDNSVFFDYTFLPEHVLAINHIVDYSQDFQLASAARTADICFGVSPVIVSRLNKFNNNAYLVSHGIHTNHTTVAVTLPGANRLKAVYAGNLDSMYLDYESLNALIKDYPNVDFIFFGSGGKHIIERVNVVKCGVIPNHLLMNYLRQADILLLLYDWKRFPDQLTNAHKVLEYLFAGKAIVSSYLSDYADKRHLLEMSDENRSVINVFQYVLSHLTELNSEALVSSRINFAKSNTYEDRIREIELLLRNLSDRSLTINRT
ncbi:glycosyltransferase family protein [Pseudochryseolinea flava]|uniref:Glycosyltransferase family 1 protein n=1 Tax=Pseudochryseolinea flava TaxID=2059302 RepID=A0A364Y8U0_9BACT|nr:hypothetical protein [Pseudochryseolinea flava]RAW02652.1 hypothetical protein DQQ10_00650 [Pseudochryseolinea flava]